MESVEELCDYICLINQSKKVLEGRKSEIKQQFKPNTFSVDFTGSINGSNATFTVQKSRTDAEGLVSATLEALPGFSSNDILKELVDRVHVIAFREDIASMNDVFLKSVKF